MPNSKFKPLAVVGVSALFPGSVDAHGFWRDILAGRDLITDVPSRRWLIEDHYDPDPQAPDKTYCKRGSFLDDVDFDPVEFGVPPTAVSATDTCQLLALIVAKQVLDDAVRGQFHEIDRERASVILGVTSGQELFLEVASRLQAPVWIKALRESGIAEDKVQEVRERIAGSYVPWQENTFPGLLGNVVAGRIANRFNLGGTNCVTDAACASSLAALSMASAELQLGHSDLVITGGADTFNDVSMFVCFSKTPALSPTGDCRPFSDQADGTILGEGLAMMALKRLDDAERDGNRIYAVIRGIGSSSDGRSKSIYAPVPEGQAKAMRRAYASAGYGPETVELVEAHGTGTVAGDAAEIASLTSVFGQPGISRRQWCALGSIKSQVGHTKAAAGSAGLFKAIMALHHRVLPPTIKVERPNPQVDLEHSPFYLNTSARPWIRGTEHPRRASVSSFGFGGTNFHVTLEEYRHAERRPESFWTAPTELVLASAGSAPDLSRKLAELARSAERHTLAEIALASQAAFDATAAERCALVCATTDELIRKLRAGSPAPGVYTGSSEPKGRIAFLFPGQGSQYVGMTSDVAMAFQDARGVWDRAPQLAKFVFPRPALTEAEKQDQVRRLIATEYAQPAMGAASAALLALLTRMGIRPDCVGGHSFGEITALYAAGAMDLNTMLRIAARRGELMASSPEQPGAMLSVRLSAGELQSRVEEWGLPLALANHNGPRQSVLSGTTSAIEEAARRLKAEQIDATRLPVATAFHSPLVAGATTPFHTFLKECPMERPMVPFYSNLNGEPHPGDPDATRALLAEQIGLPVHFQEMVERMYADGVRTFIEVGPGSVLSSLVGAILNDRPHHAIPLDRQRTHGLTSLWNALAELSAAGIGIDYQALRAGSRVQRSPSRAGERFVIPINGGNYGRPYPPKGGAAALPQPVAKSPEPPPQALTPLAAPPPPAPQQTVEAYRIFQESISEAHRNWQANLAKGHESFLRAMESAYAGAVGMPAPPELRVSRDAQPELPAAPPPTAVSVPPRELAPVAATAPKASPVTPAKSIARANVREALWDIVAESTGYPKEMLQPDMALEADLGIDSIKRVEIFSGVQQQLPDLPELDPGRLGDLRTLADIAAYLESQANGISATATAVAAQADISGIVLALIAEKTGYPAEMLQPDMSLEADLGIDSIKRVEIFSALQESAPGLSEWDTSAVGELRTIAEVIAFAGKPVAAAPRPSAKAPRQLVNEAEAPASGHVMLDPSDGPVVITNDGRIAPVAAGLLRERGYQVSVESTVPRDAAAVISLTALRRVADQEEAIALNEQCFEEAQVLAPRFAASGGIFVSVRDAGCPWTGGLPGLAKTAALEWPNAKVKSIAIERSLAAGDAAASLVHELVNGGPETEVSLRADGARMTVWARTAPLVPDHSGMAREPVLVVSGGARGVTAKCLAALARRRPCKFLLLGRSAPHSTEVRDTCRSLNEAGSEARYAQVDIRDHEAVRARVAEAREGWGPFTGVIHASGVLADRRMEKLTVEQFRSVFSTKVEGLQALLGATADDPLDTIAVFSSVAARRGNPGQSAYAMGNEAMAQIARASGKQRGSGTRVKVLDWGPWESGMVTPALRRRFESAGVSVLGMEEGAEAFADEMVGGGAAEVEVILGGLPAAVPRELRVRIDGQSHAFLTDHRIQDVPVLPVVEALELFFRCALAQENVELPLVCTDLKVLRGVRLNGFDGEGNLLIIRPRGEGMFELVGPDGTLHYQATLLPDSGGVQHSWIGPQALETAPWDEPAIYNKLLFHGPAFQVIQNVAGVSEAGIQGTVTGSEDRQWRDGFRQTDAAMLDGGLQLARLWGFHSIGKPTLPARIGRVRLFRQGAVTGPVTCRIAGAAVGTSKIVCDVEFTSASGGLVASMSEVEMYAAPGG